MSISARSTTNLIEDSATESRKLYLCFICNSQTFFNNNTEHERNSKLCQRFCILAGRYFNIKINSSLFDKTLTEGKGQELLNVCCNDCYQEINFFCQIYDQLSLLEIWANHSAKQIAKLIKKNCALNDNQGGDSNIGDFKRKFVSRVEEGHKSFPRVKLEYRIKTPRKGKAANGFSNITVSQHAKSQIVEEIEVDKAGVENDDDDDEGNIQDNIDLHMDPVDESDDDDDESYDEQNFDCRFCGKLFSKVRYRKRHEQIHAAVKKFSCRFCAKGFNFKQAMQNHERTHTGATPYKCSLCERGFKNWDVCKTHLRKIHKKNNPMNFIIKDMSTMMIMTPKIENEVEINLEFQQPVPDNVNPETEENLNDWNQNEITTLAKTDEAFPSPSVVELSPTTSCLYKCRDNTYERFSNLRFAKSSSKTESGNVANFGKQSNRDSKQREVGNGNKLQCRFCPKTFSTQKYVRQHERTHAAVKQFRCRFCNKEFTFKQTMEIHERTHTGTRPFKCTTCSKKFTQIYVCRQHIKKQHNGLGDVINLLNTFSEIDSKTEPNVQKQLAVKTEVGDENLSWMQFEAAENFECKNIFSTKKCGYQQEKTELIITELLAKQEVNASSIQEAGNVNFKDEFENNNDAATAAAPEKYPMLMQSNNENETDFLLPSITNTFRVSLMTNKNASYKSEQQQQPLDYATVDFNHDRCMIGPEVLPEKDPLLPD